MLSRRAVVATAFQTTASVLQPPPPSYAIDESFTVTHLYFYDEVTRESTLQLKQSLLEAESRSQMIKVEYHLKHPPPVHLHIHSGGGSLVSGLHICDIIERLTCPVYTFVEGSVASAASLISVCGDRRYMYKRSTLLVHQASISLGPMKNDDLITCNFFR